MKTRTRPDGYTYYDRDGGLITITLWEIIQYMLDIEKEDIIGTILDVCESTCVYSNEDYIKIQDILYAEA